MQSKLKFDLRRYFAHNTSIFEKIEKLIFTPGIWAIFLYRFGNWIQLNIKIKIIRKIVMIPFRFIHLFISVYIGIDISIDATIGKGLYIGHFGGIIINNNTVIGDYCNLSQGVTIGKGGRGKERGTPIIGTQVYIGPGAKIFGDIKIGNNVAIGANAVVNSDVPDNAVMGGVPAKILSFNSSSDFISIYE